MILDLDRMRKLIQSTPRFDDRIREAEARAFNTSARISGMPHGSGSGDRLERDAILLISIRESYAEALEELEQMRQELIPFIEMLDDPNEKAIIRLRYLKGYSPTEIESSEVMHVCGRQMYRYLNSAEAKIKKLVSECQAGL